MRAFFLVLAGLMCTHGPAAVARAKPDPLPNRLLDEFRLVTGSTGMAAAIVRDGKLVWHGESGYADLAAGLPVTTETQFRLGSVSKFVTIAMLARLVDQGRIDLSRSVQSYLPDYPVSGEGVSLLQLAAHTSGMGHYQMPQDAALDARPTPYESVAESLTIFKDRPLVHAPGTKYLYSSFAYNLLSAVMEQASGKDFLHMLSSTARVSGALSIQPELMGAPGKHWSKLYDIAGAELPRQNTTYKWAGGGMLSNASDLAQLGVTTLKPTFISPTTYASFTTPARLSNGAIVKTDRFMMGTGWRLGTDHAGRRTVHHSGVIQGGRANLSVYPDDRAAVSLLSNTMTTIAAEISAESLYDAYARRQDGGRCVIRERTYTGRYKNNDIAGTVTFSREGGFCRAVFSADSHLGRWMAPGRTEVQFVAWSRKGTGVAYYVTPAGIFPGKAAPNRQTINILGEVLELTVM